MEYSELVGSHVLSGLDDTVETVNNYGQDEEVRVIKFVLDYTTYRVEEDPSDGYRSYCKEIERCCDMVATTFIGQRVTVKMSDNSDNDILEFYDDVTGKIVLELGTNNDDDYYPSCVMNWYPENLAINIRH